MVFGRRRNIDKKIEKNHDELSSIIGNITYENINENIKNRRNEIFRNDIINMKNKIEYIINMDKKLKITYKKSNFDLYHHLIGSIHFYDNKIRKSNDINKYLNHYHKVDILINGKNNNNNLIEN